TTKCGTMDRPVAALIRDLKARGLLEETLIICGGEFGRTPFREGRTSTGGILGRDHFPDCYTMVLAGGGVESGYGHGASDRVGFGRGRGHGAGPPRHDPAPGGPRHPAIDFPLPGAGLPPARRERPSGQGPPGLTAAPPRPGPRDAGRPGGGSGGAGRRRILAL